MSVRATGLEAGFWLNFVLYVTTCLEILKDYYLTANSDFNPQQKIKMAASCFF